MNRTAAIILLGFAALFLSSFHAGAEKNKWVLIEKNTRRLFCSISGVAFF